MFSFEEKRKIAAAIEAVIREINHPEMDNRMIRFNLHVFGKESWSFADITENRPEHKPTSAWNENAREFMPKPLID